MTIFSKLKSIKQILYCQWITSEKRKTKSAARKNLIFAWATNILQIDFLKRRNHYVLMYVHRSCVYACAEKNPRIKSMRAKRHFVHRYSQRVIQPIPLNISVHILKVSISAQGGLDSPENP